MSGIHNGARHPLPWRYDPQSDSDGETIGIDHYVTDAAGGPVVLCDDEGTARLIVQAVSAYAAAVAGLVTTEAAS